MAALEVKVPDIGDFKDVEVIEVLVKPGDRVAAEQSLVTVESDKASMEIPSSAAGVVKEMKVKVGDKVNEGTLLLLSKARATPLRHRPVRPRRRLSLRQRRRACARRATGRRGCARGARAARPGGRLRRRRRGPGPRHR
jgi:pyruvate/2-oxoglutarate dehydrogenase complex dihydrolipoamide acyltransferase (E2) component